MRRFTRRNRGPYAFFAVGLLALTFGVTAGVTMSGPGQTKADIFQNTYNKACPGGFGKKKKKIGTLTAIREKGLATFRGKLHGAVPGTYTMKLYDSQCVFLLKLGEFNVDGGGDGNFAEKSFICRGQTYFMDFQHEGDGVHNSTLFFKLGSSGSGAPQCPSAGINIVKLTNGDDANSEPGPLIAVARRSPGRTWSPTPETSRSTTWWSPTITWVRCQRSRAIRTATVGSIPGRPGPTRRPARPRPTSTRTWAR